MDAQVRGESRDAGSIGVVLEPVIKLAIVFQLLCV
jgi:hypothetical protein